MPYEYQFKIMTTALSVPLSVVVRIYTLVNFLNHWSVAMLLPNHVNI